MNRRLGLLAACGLLGLVAITAVQSARAAEPVARTTEPPKAKPLNIVVYGGSGNIGSRIVNEAASRGHHVTVVDRNPKPELAPPGVKLVTGNALDPQDVLKNIADADVLVSAVIVRPTPTPDFPLNVVKALVEGLRLQTGGKKTRFIDVGGASSLNNAEGKRIIDTFPAGRGGGEARSSVDALDWLRAEVKDVPWTFFSPAGRITPGMRTGKFRIGTDTVVTDANGQSAISIEDYAVAMVDEMEKPQFINRRFTVGY
jgi:putative NADH-flavin reductase